ncbi:unnamed protein product [Schistosoma mattheei]|uniref:Uncharacterized protein n=1 Tax=Schistosoma mattheei TaxID=31246 RepID=A0A183PAF7_9TREM|nr:unnamed protein product [Schistosoma mattheei]
MLSQAGIKYRRRNSHHESPNSPSRQTLASIPHKYSTVASRGDKIRQPTASGGSTTNPTDDKQLTTSTKLGHVFMQACIFKVGDDVRQVSNYYHGKRINDNRLMLLTNSYPPTRLKHPTFAFRSLNFVNNTPVNRNR